MIERIERRLTEEERTRHQQIREQIAEEMPEIAAKAREALRRAGLPAGLVEAVKRAKSIANAEAVVYVTSRPGRDGFRECIQPAPGDFIEVCIQGREILARLPEWDRLLVDAHA
jgi:hypothetical protein